MNTYSFVRLAAMAVLALLCFPSILRAQVEWRVSVKRILDANGNRPSAGFPSTDEHIQLLITNGNAALDRTGRGYRLRLTEIVDVPNVEEWFEAEIKDVNRFALEFSAETDKARYVWRDDAINIYINNATNGSGGICSFPNTAQDIIFIGQRASRQVLLHEIGHYMGLYHTQGSVCNDCDANGILDLCNRTPGTDFIDDTLPDLPCWDENQIAQYNFQRNYAALTPAEQDRVNEAFFNVMSYHNLHTRFRLTPSQMDNMADASNGPRSHVATGRTWFVDPSGVCVIRRGGVRCTGIDGPFNQVREGVNAANPNGGDIVLIRPNSYNEQLTINKPVTLRATLQGPVTIGR